MKWFVLAKMLNSAFYDIKTARNEKNHSLLFFIMIINIGLDVIPKGRGVVWDTALDI